MSKIKSRRLARGRSLHFLVLQQRLWAFQLEKFYMSPREGYGVRLCVCVCESIENLSIASGDINDDARLYEKCTL